MLFQAQILYHQKDRSLPVIPDVKPLKCAPLDHTPGIFRTTGHMLSWSNVESDWTSGRSRESPFISTFMTDNFRIWSIDKVATSFISELDPGDRGLN